MNNEHEILQALYELIGKLDNRISGLGDSVKEYGKTSKGASDNTKDFAKEVDRLQLNINPLKKEIYGAAESARDLAKKMGEAGESASKFYKKAETLRHVGFVFGELSTGITSVLGVMDHLHNKFDKQFKVTKDYFQILSQSAMTFGTYTGGLRSAVLLQDNFQKTLEKIRNESYLTTPQAQALFDTIQKGYRGVRDDSALNSMSDLTAELSRTYVTAEEATKAFQDLQSAASKYAEVKNMLYKGDNLSDEKMMQMLNAGALNYEQIERIREVRQMRNASPEDRATFERGRERATNVQRENQAYGEREFRENLATADNKIAQSYLSLSKGFNSLGIELDKTIGGLRALSGILGDLSILSGGMSGGIEIGGNRMLARASRGKIAAGVAAPSVLNALSQFSKGKVMGGVGSLLGGGVAAAGIESGAVTPVYITGSAIPIGGSGPLDAALGAMGGGVGWKTILTRIGVPLATAAAGTWLTTKLYSDIEEHDPEYNGVSKERKAESMRKINKWGWIGGMVAGAGTGAALGALGANPFTIVAGALIGGISGALGGASLADAMDSPEKINNSLESIKDKSKDIFGKWQEINQEFEFSIEFSKQMQQAYGGVVGELSGMTGLGQRAEQAAMGQLSALKDQLSSELKKEASYDEEFIKPITAEVNANLADPNFVSNKMKILEEQIKAAAAAEINPEGTDQDRENARQRRLSLERNKRKASEDPEFFRNQERERLVSLEHGKEALHLSNIALSYKNMKSEIEAALVSERDLVEQKKIEADLARSEVELSREARLGMGVDYQLTLKNIAAVNEQLVAENNVLSVMKEQYNAEKDKKSDKAIYLLKQIQKEQTTINNLDRERLALAKDIREGYLQAFDAAVIGAGAFAQLLPKEGFGHQYFANTPTLGGVQGTGPLISSPTMVTTSGIQYGKNAAGYMAETARENKWANGILGPGMYNTAQDAIGGIGALAQEAGMNTGAGKNINLGNVATMRGNNIMGGVAGGLASTGNFIVKALGMGGLLGSEQTAAASSATQVAFQAVGTVTVPVVFDIKDEKGSHVATANASINLIQRQFANGGFSSL